MKYLKRLISFSLAMIMVCITILPTYASDNINTNVIHGVEVFEGDEYLEIHYTEQREDGTYYISESVNGNTIHSKIYRVKNGEKMLSSTIVSKIHGDNVFCVETKDNEKVDKYQISAKARGDFVLKGKKYLRTEKYGISLVGKKLTITTAAGAIVTALPYVSLSVAIKIITAAIAGGTGLGVQGLPDYLYVTSDVYTSSSVGKIYTRYENKYYLDSARTQYIGSWTFSKRWGH